MVVFSPFVLLLCTFWELCARFLIYILLFTDQKKKKKRHDINKSMHHQVGNGFFSIGIKLVMD